METSGCKTTSMSDNLSSVLKCVLKCDVPSQTLHRRCGLLCVILCYVFVMCSYSLINSKLQPFLWLSAPYWSLNSHQWLITHRFPRPVRRSACRLWFRWHKQTCTWPHVPSLQTAALPLLLAFLHNLPKSINQTKISQHSTLYRQQKYWHPFTETWLQNISML